MLLRCVLCDFSHQRRLLRDVFLLALRVLTVLCVVGWMCCVVGLNHFVVVSGSLLFAGGGAGEDDDDVVVDVDGYGADGLLVANMEGLTEARSWLSLMTERGISCLRMQLMATYLPWSRLSLMLTSYMKRSTQ